MSLTKEQDEFITALYKEMFKKLVNIGYELLGNLALAEEMAQEAFLIACKKPDDVMNSENPQGWMVKTLHNLVKNLKRVLSNQDKYIINASRSYDKTVHIDDYADIEYSDMLSIEEYRLFRRITLDHYSMREAAEEFGISIEACKKRVQRTRAKLRKQIMRDMEK